MKKEKKVFYKADLELIAIDEKQLRYRINDAKGAPFNLHHLILIRDDKFVPRNERFTMDALSKDLSLSKPYTKDEGERFTEDKKKAQEKALDETKKEQVEYRKFMNMKIEITHD